MHKSRRTLFPLVLIIWLSAGCASRAWAPYDFPEKTVETLRNAVVEVRAYGAARCSGAFVQPRIIITASHCVYSGLNIEFSQYEDQNRFFEADVIYHNANDDISILRTRNRVAQTYLEIEPNLSELTVSEIIATMGHPEKRERLSDWLQLFPRHMYWLSTGKAIGYHDNGLVADIKIAPGSSGGPLVNEDGKIIGVTSAIGINLLDPFSFNLVGFFISRESLDQARAYIAEPDVNLVPPLPWTAAESTLYTNVGFAIRNNRYSTMPWIPTISLGYSHAGRVDFAVGTSPFFGNEFGWYYERLRFYLPVSNGYSSFRVGAGILCQQTDYFNGSNSDMSSCLPEVSIGVPLLDLGIQFGASDSFIRAMVEIRIMRWLSSLGY